MNIELISQILLLAITSTFISTQLIQRLKENFRVKNWLLLAIVSFIISCTTGFLFTISFSELNYSMACWVAIITYAGAEIIYQKFKEKLGLKTLTELEKGDSNNEM